MPLLSILIPSIPSRFDRAIKLYNHILNLVGDKDIEVLMLTDNKKQTIGEKRDALKDECTGDYFMFVDDDDWLIILDDIYEACKNENTRKDVDVITFKFECQNNDGSTFIVTAGLGNEVEHNTENGRYMDCKRPPFHNCAWNRKFQNIKYPAINYSEDWEWVKEALCYAETEFHIDKVLYKYNAGISEASTESNEYWKNPNGISIPDGNKVTVVTEEMFEDTYPSEIPPRRCIVNLATGKYIDGQYRLRESITDNEFIGFQSEVQVGAPEHYLNPYAFKIYAIEECRRRGYDQILWLDASVYAVKDITPVWNWLDKYGIFMEEAGHWAGTWSPDYVLKYFNINKEQAMLMPMFSAGFVGFDFRKNESIEFFARWKESMLNGMFKGSWSEHRHDMTCGSIIANQMGLNKNYSSGGQFFAYVGPGYSEPLESACFHLKGIP